MRKQFLLIAAVSVAQFGLIGGQGAQAQGPVGAPNGFGSRQQGPFLPQGGRQFAGALPQGRAASPVGAVNQYSSYLYYTGQLNVPGYGYRYGQVYFLYNYGGISDHYLPTPGIRQHYGYLDIPGYGRRYGWVWWVNGYGGFSTVLNYYSNVRR